MSVVFRPATADDLPAIVALLDDDAQSKGREDPRLPLDQRYLAAFEAIDADPNQLQVVAECGLQRLNLDRRGEHRGALAFQKRRRVNVPDRVANVKWPLAATRGAE